MALITGTSSYPRQPVRGSIAFTLIELMVVVTIITLLAMMLAPLLNQALEMTRVTTCAANLRAHGLAWRCYLSDNSETFPQYFRGMDWCYGGKQPALCESPPQGQQSTPLNNYRPLNPYLQLPLAKVSKAEYFHCPSDHGVGAIDPGSSTYNNSCYDWFGNRLP
jgi:prepilin-type N-terminal cleavage/methylation domain-containing protein